MDAQHLGKNLVDERVEVDAAIQILPVFLSGRRRARLREQKHEAVSLSQEHIVDAEEEQGALVDFRRTVAQQRHILEADQLISVLRKGHRLMCQLFRTFRSGLIQNRHLQNDRITPRLYHFNSNMSIQE